MVYLVGAVSQEEMEELERRGWKIDEPPDDFLTSKEYLDKDEQRDDIWVMIYVDNYLFNCAVAIQPTEWAVTEDKT